MTKHYQYFFNKAYEAIPQAKVRECREKLVNVISRGRNGTFYTYLANGIRDIRLPLYEEITQVFIDYGIPPKKIWRKEPVEVE